MIRNLSILILSILVSFTALANLKIDGAGASFPFPIYSKWFAEYEKTNTEVKFNYQAIGSGGGIRQVLKQTVDFGASDAPMKKKDMDKSAAKGWPILHVPTVLGAVAVAFNVPGINEIKLDGETLALIFMAEINKWNDKRIAKLNKGVKLPNADILVVRRADGSGTTAILADYLASVSQKWDSNMGRGKTLKWSPFTIGQKGNSGVTASIKKTPNSIGYVELAYALKNDLGTVAVKNKAGEFTLPSVEGVSKSAAGIKDYSGSFARSIVDAEGSGVYPISAFTYILYPKRTPDQKLTQIKKFLGWALTTGQDYAESLYYAPLPEKLAKAVLKKLD